MHTVLKHCSDSPPPDLKLGKEHKAVALVKDVGISPHKYQTGLRINLAKDRLAKGADIVDVAISLGFSD